MGVSDVRIVRIVGERVRRRAGDTLGCREGERERSCVL